MLERPQYRGLRASRKDIQELIRRTTPMAYSGVERRAVARVPIAIGLECEPLTADLRSNGDCFHVVTVDLSTDGAGFVSPSRIEDPFVLLRFRDLEIVAEVTWRNDIGDGNFQRLGVQFLVDDPA